MDVLKIDTTHWRGQRGVRHVIIMHDIVLQALWLSLCSDVIDGRGHIVLVVIGLAVITGSIYWWELIITQVDECSGSGEVTTLSAHHGILLFDSRNRLLDWN